MHIFLYAPFLHIIVQCVTVLQVRKWWVATQISVARPSTLGREIVKIYILNLPFSLDRTSAIIYILCAAFHTICARKLLLSLVV